jgi:MarR family transcriptional regulator for hemolysin
MDTLPGQAGGELLEVVPSIARAVREQMRRHRTADLSVTQFRVLAFLNRRAGASLSDVADHIGLTLPSMSKLIDQLVTRKYVIREYDTIDRRRVTLALTGRGRTILESARTATREFLTTRLEQCERGELETILAAMRILRPLFASPREAQRAALDAQEKQSSSPRHGA